MDHQIFKEKKVLCNECGIKRYIFVKIEVLKNFLPE
jgi:hypothetical protein